MEHSQHRPLLICVGALGFVCVAASASAQSFEAVTRRFNRGIVRITALFRDRSGENGFGIVVRESGDSLFLVTASHVVQPADADEPSDSVFVSFFERDGRARAIVLNHDARRDLALLAVPKPPGFSWKYRGALADVVTGDRVWIVGRDFSWRATARDARGQVTQTGDEIVADFRGTEPGASGGPLFSRGGIAGMVINDEGNEATALDINVVTAVVYKEWLQLQGLAVRDFPFVAVSGGVGFDGVASRAAGQPTFPPITWSAALDVAVAPKIAFGVAASRAGIASLDVTVPGHHYQFRNRGTTYSGSLRFYPASTLERSEYVFVGVSSLRINPQLRVDDGVWTQLRDADSVTYDYKDRAWAFGLGIGFGSVSTGNLMTAMELSMSYTTSPYLSINALDPYTPQTTNDWLFVGTLKVGYVLRPARANLKILR